MRAAISDEAPPAELVPGSGAVGESRPAGGDAEAMTRRRAYTLVRSGALLLAIGALCIVHHAFTAATVPGLLGFPCLALGGAVLGVGWWLDGGRVGHANAMIGSFALPIAIGALYAHLTTSEQVVLTMSLLAFAAGHLFIPRLGLRVVAAAAALALLVDYALPSPVGFAASLCGVAAVGVAIACSARRCA